MLDHRLAILLRDIVNAFKISIELAREVYPRASVAIKHAILRDVLDKRKKDGRVYSGSYN